MRLWLDTEFHEHDGLIELISIGLAREDGGTYYAEAQEYDRTRMSPWLRNYVAPHLGGPVLPREEIRNQLVAFCGSKPEFWGWYGAYDWVVLCQLFGGMMELPDGWPVFIREARQYCSDRAKLPIRRGPQHHALADAEWQRQVWHSLIWVK
ncbi:3'-5' exoribonuclease domain-containing protein [Ferrovibrio sp.]|uniref:3'-5' exoribonuclease domain-containing protein n=1 Tax=Ferrovibrio sp. TaxID=1917215 RepID=UPI00312021AA